MRSKPRSSAEKDEEEEDEEDGRPSSGGTGGRRRRGEFLFIYDSGRSWLHHQLIHVTVYGEAFISHSYQNYLYCDERAAERERARAGHPSIDYFRFFF